MAEVARIRWQSPMPTSVDEELVVYDDATALLVVRTSRDGAPVIGTWTATVEPQDLAVLDGERREVDLVHPVPDPVVAIADQVAADAREHPVATATFYTGVVPGGGVALLAVGGGTAPAEFELGGDSVGVHLGGGGTEGAWDRIGR